MITGNYEVWSILIIFNNIQIETRTVYEMNSLWILNAKVNGIWNGL